MVRKSLAVMMIVVMVGQFGCYNTYRISLEEMQKAQYGGDLNAVAVSTEEGTEIVVSEDTKIGVTTRGGDYWAVSPFNFTLDKSRLIAPDEDLMLDSAEIETGNVKQVSAGKTVGLVLGGLAVVIAGGLAISLTATEERAYSQ